MFISLQLYIQTLFKSFTFVTTVLFTIVKLYLFSFVIKIRKMRISAIKQLYKTHKESDVFGRYITNENIQPLLDRIQVDGSVAVIGHSVLSKPIYGLTVGKGPKRILLWSQMHGNESTTTKALFDLLNTLLTPNKDLNHILESCTLYIIPILNPDGATLYTRLNANEVDLNRDAQNLSQPESRVLRAVFTQFKPDFCFNLHGQRTIFSAGTANRPATVSFLAPAQDEACSITENRKKAMELISIMNTTLQEQIPDQIGVYDDAFNINCVGDTFQSYNVPTVLFEAGHYPNDYHREVTRELIYATYITALDYISKTDISGDHHQSYFKIPENAKCFYDIIIRNALINNTVTDIAVQYEERLVDDDIHFVPIIEKIELLPDYYGHKEIDARCGAVLSAIGTTLECASENVFVMLNNEKISLLIQ